MAQVALQTGPTSGTWSASATPTINTPAGADGERQILVVTWSVGSTVVAPAFSGWTHAAEEYITSTQNRTAIYTRVISGTVAAGTVSPTFSAAITGRYWAGSFNGIPVAVALVADSGWSSSRVVPATSASEIESLHLVMMVSASYPRSVAAVTGYTEVHDAYAYHAGGGVWLGVNRKDVTTGAVASSTWTIYEETGVTPTGDQTIYASIILGPIPAASATADITVAGEFPIPTTVEIARTTGGTLAVNATDTVTATVRDHNGDPIRNVVPTVGAISGGVFTLTAFAATDASGETTATLTAAVIGEAALIVSVGASYSNEITVTVIGSVSTAITAVTVTPASATIATSGTQQFAAVVTGTGAFDSAVTWSVESGDGTISTAGLFTAAATAGSVTIRATSVQDPSKYDDSAVTVTAVGEAVTVTPRWVVSGASFASQALDYVVKNSTNQVIATGTGTTNSSGEIPIEVPAIYSGALVMIQVENVGTDMDTAGKFHSTKVMRVP